MGVLSAKQRKASAVVRVGGKSKFPVPDAAHAKAALARINQAKPPLTGLQKSAVRSRANAMLGAMPPPSPGAMPAKKMPHKGKHPMKGGK